MVKLVERWAWTLTFPLSPRTAPATALRKKPIWAIRYAASVNKWFSRYLRHVYDLQAIITIDGVTFMTLYWSGADRPQGFSDLGGAASGRRRLCCTLKWDRTVSTAQTVSVLGARQASTYLASPLTDDRSLGALTFNDTTKAVDVQFTNLGAQRGAIAQLHRFACWKMYGVGVYGGAMKWVRPMTR